MKATLSSILCLFFFQSAIASNFLVSFEKSSIAKIEISQVINPTPNYLGRWLETKVVHEKMDIWKKETFPNTFNIGLPIKVIRRSTLSLQTFFIFQTPIFEGSFSYFQWWGLVFISVLVIGLGIFFYKRISKKYRKQNKLLEFTVYRRTNALNRADEEIRAQNEELTQLAEELSRQRDFLKLKNEELEQKNNEIKKQSKSISEYSYAIERMNKELKRANEALDSKVTDRTIHLEKARKELDNFVYRVSHDIRSPLSSMLGLVKLINSSSTIGETKNYVNYLEQGINKLDKFTGDILDYSRNSRISTEWKTIDFGKLVKEILEEMQFMEGFSRVSFNIPNTGEAILSTDIYRLKLVMRNLISNSIRYQNPYVSTSAVDILFEQAIGGPIITIRDNGMGISDQHLPNIFDMFYRGSDCSNGSGLGLYIAKEALEKIGGSIAVTSEESKGTCFQIALMETMYPIQNEAHLSEEMESDFKSNLQ